MIYEYKCKVCDTVFEVMCSLSEHKETQDCGYCYSKESALQHFTPDNLPSVKVYDNSILKNITFDRE